MSLSVVAGLGWRFAAPRVAPAASGNTGAAAVGKSAGNPGNSATAQPVQTFLQALYEALSNAEAIPAASMASNASNTTSVYSPPLGPSYSRGSVASYRANGYQQGPTGLQGKIKSLVGALSDPDEATDSNVRGLQSAFNRLLQDLQGSGTSIAFNSSAGSSELTLRGWLLGLQQNLQQPGATDFSTLGNSVDVVV
jgi:hypothetical protein